MNKTEAQKKAIEERYSKEGEISKKKESRYNEEGGKTHKEANAYRTKKDSKEDKGMADKEGRVGKKCSTCGQMMKAENVTDRV